MANPSWFNEAYYLTSKLEQLQASGETAYTNVLQVKAAIEAAGMTVYEHFSNYSLVEGTSPNQYFNTGEYLAAKAVQAGMTVNELLLAFQSAGFTNAYDHFARHGWQEGVNPSNAFDVSDYLAAKAVESGLTVAEVTAAFVAGGFDPISHYVEYGEDEGVVVTPVPVDEQVEGGSGQDFALTTGTDSIPGSSGNDSITGTDSTFTAFDTIDGAAGTDTLTLTVTSAAFDFDTDGAGATVASVENVVIQSAAQDVSGDISGWTGVENVTVNVTGASADVDLITAAAQAVAITGSRDIAIEDATTTSVSITTNDADASEDDVVAVTAAAMTSLTLNAAEGTVVTLDTESTALTINAATNDTDGSAGDDVVVVDASDTGAGIVTDLTINVTDDSELDLDFAQATALAVLGSADLSLTETDLNAVETVTVAGSAGLSGVLSGMAALESIVSTSTGNIEVTIAATALEVTTGAGDDTITQAAALGATQAISTGAGDDTVVLGATPIAGATVDAGDGSDMLGVLVANIGVDHSAVISNFESLRVSGALGAATLDVANFDDVQEVLLSDGFNNAASAITGLDTDATIISTTAGGAAAVLTVAINDADTGDADELTVGLIPAAAGDFGNLDIQDLETLNLDVASTGAAGDNITLGFSANQDFTTLNLAQASGDFEVADLIIDTALTVVNTVDASDMGEGNVTINFTGNSGYTYTGAAGVDTVTLGTLGTVTGGEGTDAFVVTQVADGNVYSTITDLADGETITFTDAGDYAGGIGDDIVLADTAAFADYLQAATAGTTAGEIEWFQFGGNTYIVNDSSATAAFVNGTDDIVKITGLVDLSDSSVSAAGVVTYTVA